MSSHNLAICVATMQAMPNGGAGIEPNAVVHMCGGPAPGLGMVHLNTFFDNATASSLMHIKYNTSDANDGVVGSYQKLYEQTDASLLAFIHDDVICHEKGWDERVLAEFEDPSVGVVGFGGALGHGDPDLYKIPYRLEQLRRFDYLSNVDDAEVHGARFSDSTEVAVLDGYCLIVRRDLLDRAHGWRGLASGCDFFCYDYALCAMARRLGFRTRVVGVRCHHLGGRTSVVHEAAAKITSRVEFEHAHRWFYETYRDVMPWRVE